MVNRQLLWHMLFGYIIVRTLMPLVHLLGRLGGAAVRRHPQRAVPAVPRDQLPGSPVVAAAATPADGRDHGRHDDALNRRLAAETPASLALTMHFPTRWDPYFRDTMSVLDVYHYGTEHYDHHHRQLTI